MHNKAPGQVLNALRQKAFSTTVTRFSPTEVLKLTDSVAIEAPLEIRLKLPNTRLDTVTVTMRTPGEDIALALGYLFSEGIIHELSDVAHVGPDTRLSDVVVVKLDRDPRTSTERLNRNVSVSSSCGACGKNSKQALELPIRRHFAPMTVRVGAKDVHGMPNTLRENQTVFRSTGGMHGAALFLPSGKLMVVMEDVGRHNAVDKAIGWQVLDGYNDPRAAVLAVSGRVSFEIVQKAYMAGVSVIVAVGAPTSLAVDLACSYDLTLIGFVSDDRFNVYARGDRVQ